MLFCFCTGISYTAQCLKDRGLKKLKLHPGWSKRFHVLQKAKPPERGLRSSGTPTPNGTAGPGSPQARQKDNSTHRALALGCVAVPRASPARRKRASPARPHMAGGAQAQGRPGARYLRSGGGLLLLRASFGRPGPRGALALVRLAPDSFSLSFPLFAPSSAVAPRWRRRDGSRERRAGQVSLEARGRGRGMAGGGATTGHALRLTRP